MAWGFLDWVRGRPYRSDPNELRLSEHPSDTELRELLRLLLDDVPAFKAYELLDQHPTRARPMLEKLLRDDSRYRNKDVMLCGWGRPRFDVMLTILFEWKSDYALNEAQTLAASQDANLRAVAARLLASTGQSRFGTLLARLSNDGDAQVRQAVAEGLHHVLEYPNRDYSMQDGLALALYDFMLECALRTDRGCGIRFASALFRVDRERALRDFAPDVVLTIDRNWLDDLLTTLRKQGIPIPLARTLRLLDDAMAILNRPDDAVRDYPSLSSLIAELLCVLAERNRDDVQKRMRLLRRHPQEEARKAALEARERLSPDPVKLVLEACNTAGNWLAMREEHKVVYLVWLLDCEVSNGGWLQWVVNPPGAYARETERALREVGAVEAAAELCKVSAILGPEGSAEEQKRRQQVIDRIMQAGRSLPDDGVMWMLSTELRQLLYDYAEHHTDAFPRTS